MPRPPVALHSRVLDDLAFIRATMARSGRFTAVSGKGGVAIGVIGLVAAALANQQPTDRGWLGVWLAAAAVGLPLDAAFIVAKARRLGEPVLRGAGRTFLFSLAPAVTVAALFTVPLYSAGQLELLPPLWLLHYGAGVLAAGMFSVPAVPVMGLAFCALGGLSLFLQPGSGDLLMALGFGGLNVVFGAVIWRRYGG